MLAFLQCFNGMGGGDFVAVLLIFLFSFGVCWWAVMFFELKNVNVAVVLLIVHLLSSIAAAEVMTVSGSDAYGYWSVAKGQPFTELGYAFGTDFMSSVAWIPSEVLGLSFLGSNLFLSVFGLVGFYALQSYIEKISSPRVLWFLVLPNLHFWTAYLGKDTLVFFSVCMVIWGVWGCAKFWPLLLLLPGFMVRPHVAIIVVVLATARLVVKSRIAGFFALIVAVLLFVFVGPLIADYLKIESAADAFTKSEMAADYYTEGSSIDMSGWPLPVRVFGFLFFPLGVYATTVLQYIASLENFIFLGVFLWVLLRYMNRRRFVTIPWAALLAFLFLACILGGMMNNLGLAMRQKVQVMPFFVVLLASSFALPRSNCNTPVSRGKLK